MATGMSQKKSSTKENWDKYGAFLDKYYDSICSPGEYAVDAWYKYHRFLGYKTGSALKRLRYSMYCNGNLRNELSERLHLRTKQ